jgi:hypothetical protein
VRSAICAEAESMTAASAQQDPALKSITPKFQKLTPHHQDVVIELINGLIKLQKRDEEPGR